MSESYQACRFFVRHLQGKVFCFVVVFSLGRGGGGGGGGGYYLPQFVFFVHSIRDVGEPQHLVNLSKI